jgi:hypothetical protein
MKNIINYTNIKYITINMDDDHKNKNHWLLRIGDGRNFRNSVYPFWSVKRGKNNSIKGCVRNIAEGDILWFITNQSAGGKIIGMAEFTYMYDIKEKPTSDMTIFSNSEQDWIGDDVWDIQIYYKNMYKTENANINICIRCNSSILSYITFRDRISHNLYREYDMFLKYGQPNNVVYVE